jgi:hypothetical protein
MLHFALDVWCVAWMIRSSHHCQDLGLGVA